MTISNARQYPKAAEWILGFVSLLIPYTVWASAGGTFRSQYSVFPLLGLWAWSLMWTHYMYGTLGLVSDKFARSKRYKQITGYLVLALILLHPLLLISRLYEDTGAKPPDSYINYVGEANKLFVLFGTLSLISFLAYELLHRLRKLAVIRRVWILVSAAQAVAMVLIFIHGLKLGSHLYGGWFQAYWVLLGCLLIPCFAVILRHDWQHRPSRTIL